MKLFSKFSISWLLIAFLQATSAPAYAYSFTFSDGTDSGYGELSTLASGLATSGSLTITSGTETGVYSLIANPSTSPWISPSGLFEADNITYFSSNPLLDTSGLLFGNGSTEINIWGNGLSSPWRNAQPPYYSFWTETNGAYSIENNSTQFEITPNAINQNGINSVIPEPGVALLIPAGLLALGISRKKQKA